MKKSLYATLGVDPKAGIDEIRAAHDQRLAAAEAKQDTIGMVAIKEAWSVLGHTQRRATYDASLLDSRLTPARGAGAPARGARPAPRSAATHTADKPPAGRMLWIGVALAMLITGGLLVRHHKASARASMPARRLLTQDGAQPTMVSVDPARMTPPSTADATGPALGAEALFARASASVVRVNVESMDGRELGHGSGVVVDHGKVITNCHVANAGPSLKVLYREQTYVASVLISDEDHDLCRLSVPGLGAPPAAIARGSALHVGQKVYAIGSPRGLDLTLSDGMVSSLRGTDDGPLIQTTAPVSPGSSGGGLFNEQGALVGIVTFQMRNGQNLNFAVPSDWIERMSNTHTESRGEPRQVATADGVDPAIIGTWHCFGPLTGRGLEMTLDERGQASGSFDGKPISGTYRLQNKQLSLMGNLFLVEELSSSRMVLSKGDGRRLACNH